MSDFYPYQLERLTPDEIEAALAKRSLVFVPLGTVEWHGQHLPVGYDALCAHLLCLHTAKRTGGLVMPPSFVGTGGGHGGFPWTVMPPAEVMRPALDELLRRLRDFGVKHVVLYSGHTPPEQRDVVEGLAADHGDEAMRVTALHPVMGNEFFPAKMDHAALFETALGVDLMPDLVHLDRLASVEERSATAEISEMFSDETHPLYGVWGPDPREMPADLPAKLSVAVRDWMVAMVEEASPVS